MKTKRLRINERAIGWAKKSVNAFFGNWNWRVDRGRSFFWGGEEWRGIEWKTRERERRGIGSEIEMQNLKKIEKRSECAARIRVAKRRSCAATENEAHLWRARRRRASHA